jgi:hypothetical protein
MPFGNNNNQTTSPRINPLIWVFLAAVPLFFFVFRMTGERERRSADPHAESKPAITYSERVRQTQALCESVPKPDEFYLVDRMAPTETARMVAVSHKFTSARSQEELFPTFIIWFTSNGWTDNRTPYKPLEFSKDNKTIGIAPVRANDGDYYLITCTEWILN